ncbi:MAG: NAD(P)H-dependent oxidoreductase [bacterium]|nr:NAD(P)H-dependent oxidoreductase [bacterium]
MKILLITAHPNPNSTSHQFAEIALQEFEAKGHKVELIHLYQEKALQFGYLQFTQGQKIPSNDQELRQSWQERVRRANKIIFFFPTWWNDFPAVLKSWFENVII